MVGPAVMLLLAAVAEPPPAGAAPQPTVVPTTAPTPRPARDLSDLAAGVKLRGNPDGSPIVISNRPDAPGATVGSVPTEGPYREQMKAWFASMASLTQELKDLRVFEPSSSWQPRDPSWTESVRELAYRLEAKQRELAAIQPPASASAWHAGFAEVTEDLLRGTRLALQAAETQDSTLADRACNAMKQASQRLDELTRGTQAASGPSTTRGASSSTKSDSDSAAQIKTHCEREWPDDYRMRLYCVNQQKEGLASLQRRVAPAGVSEEELQQIRAKCRAEWPGDYRMENYCEEQQLKALLELKGQR
jgi:hypothetical protein